MAATITRLADYEPKHRRASSSPPILFPGSDPASDPLPQDPDTISRARIFLDAGSVPEHLEVIGEPAVASAMRRLLRPRWLRPVAS